MCLGPRAGCYVTESRLAVATPALLRYVGMTPPPSIPARTSCSTVRPDRRTAHGRDTDEGPGAAKPKAIEEAVTNIQADRQPEALRLAEGRALYTDLVHHDRRTSPARLETGPVGLARRVAPTLDQRTDRRSPPARGRRRPDDRDAAREHLPRRAQRDRDGRGRTLVLAILAMTVGLIRGESGWRPPHSDRGRGHEHGPPDLDRRHCRRVAFWARCWASRARMLRLQRRTSTTSAISAASQCSTSSSLSWESYGRPSRPVGCSAASRPPSPGQSSSDGGKTWTETR